MISSYSNSNKSALIVEGGAMRSVFSAGLLDGFLARQFNPFDFFIGVSAGAYNLTTYLAGQSGLGLQIYCDLATHRQFISYPRFLRGGHLLDLDWLSHAIASEYMLDTVALFEHGKPLYVCVTNVGTGQANYIAITPEIFERVIKASTALPLIYRDFPLVNNSPMTDGGVADGIPIAEAIRRGAKRILVVRSRHYTYAKKDTFWHKTIRWKLRNHDALVKTLRERIIRFEKAIQIIRQPPPGVSVLEICPPKEFNLGRFCRNRKRLEHGYVIGLQMAGKAIQRWDTLDEGHNTL